MNNESELSEIEIAAIEYTHKIVEDLKSVDGAISSGLIHIEPHHLAAVFISGAEFEKGRHKGERDE